MLSEPFAGTLTTPENVLVYSSRTGPEAGPTIVTSSPLRRSAAASCCAWCFTPPHGDARSYVTIMQIRSGSRTAGTRAG